MAPKANSCSPRWSFEGRKNFAQLKNFYILKYLLFSLTFADKPSAKLVLKISCLWRADFAIPNPRLGRKNNYKLQKNRDQPLFFLAMEEKNKASFLLGGTSKPSGIFSSILS